MNLFNKYGNKDEPTEIDEYGSKYWKNDKGRYHRKDGHAIEWKNGSKQWYINGLRHREDGPAIEYANGTKQWWVNGKPHRIDGPAIEYANGHKEWWVNRNLITLDTLSNMMVCNETI